MALFAASRPCPGPIRGNRGYDMHKFGFALTSSVLLLASAGAADAGCIKKGQGFRTELRPTVNYFFATDNGRCGDGFTSGSKTVFTSASIVTTPGHGKLEQIGRSGSDIARIRDTRERIATR